MMYKSIAVLLGLSFMSGCASTTDEKSSQQLTKVQEEKLNKLGYRCTTIKPTGSRLTKKRCTTSVQREEEARVAREALRQAEFND